MTTQEIVKEMEKEFGKQFTNSYGGDSGFGGNYPQESVYEWATDSPKDVLDFIHSYTRTLLESFGEEIINAENKVEDLYPYYQERARNLLRAEQRLKVKEIIKSSE